MNRIYQYVGPDEILNSNTQSQPGAIIQTRYDLEQWLENTVTERRKDGAIIATFVVDLNSQLRLAPRRSEHVRCANGAAVLAAGEIGFLSTEAIEISNQSTGYCPEPSCWQIVSKTLDSIPIVHPGQFTLSVTFRKCIQCGQRNLVKNDFFECSICQTELPAEWNF